MRMNNIELLDPKFKGLVKIFLTRLDQLGILYIVYETKRTRETQEAYYAQGRAQLLAVNELRKKAGLYELSESENDRTITNTLDSKHLKGLAIDIVPMKDNMLWWNAPDTKWKEIADVAKECGLYAGYFWKSKDSPHIEMK